MVAAIERETAGHGDLDPVRERQFDTGQASGCGKS